MEDVFDIYPHKKFGYCEKCGRPIWAAVIYGFGCVPATNKCWACASEDEDYEVIHFDFVEVSEEEQQEYLAYIKEQEDGNALE